MRIKFMYRNHNGNVFQFGDGYIFVNKHELYNYGWDSTIVGTRVGKLERRNAPRVIPIVFISQTAADVNRAIDEFIDLAEIDTIARKSGSIFVNNYQFRCFIISVEFVDWIQDGGFCKINLTVQPDGGVWTREFPAKPFNSSTASIILEGDDNFSQPLKKYAFFPPSEETPDYTAFIYGVPVSSDQLPAQKNYSYQYAESNEHRQIEVVGNCKMRLSLYGPYTLSDGLTIVIGEQEYKFGGEGCLISLNANEKIILDQERETIEKEYANGERTNAFAVWMDMNSNLFQPLPQGVHDVIWSGISFYLTLIEERSSPRWH